MKKSVGEMIAMTRRRAALTQSRLAERLGVSQSRVADLEADRCSPTVDMLRRVAKALGAEPGDLI